MAAASSSMALCDTLEYPKTYLQCARLLPGEHAVHGGGLLQHGPVLLLVKLERGRQVLGALLVRAVVHHLHPRAAQRPSAQGKGRMCSHSSLHCGNSASCGADTELINGNTLPTNC